MNEPESVARILTLVQRDKSPNELFEDWYFETKDVDTIPEGWQVRITYTLQRKQNTVSDLWKKMRIEVPVP